MKIMICGKGGSGKSTITVLLARAFSQSGKKVLVVDADESNQCLHRLLGVTLPENIMDHMGGRKGVREKLFSKEPVKEKEAVPLKAHMGIDDIPDALIADADGVKLLLIGKITEFGEGCACMIGNISKHLLGKLDEGPDAVVIIDAEAGLEHFGRRVNTGCDLMFCVIDPTYESLEMSKKARFMAEKAGVDLFFILNKMDDTIHGFMTGNVDPEKLVATIPQSHSLFMESLKGCALTTVLPQIGQVRKFIDSYKVPARLNIF